MSKISTFGKVLGVTTGILCAGVTVAAGVFTAQNPGIIKDYISGNKLYTSSEYEKLQKDSNILQISYDKAVKMLSEEKDKVKTLENTVSTLSTTIVNNEQTIKNLTDSNAGLETQVASLTKDISEKQAEVTLLEEQVESKNSEISQLSQDKTSLQNQITTLNAEITEKQNTLIGLNNQIELNNARISELEAQGLVNSEEITRLTNLNETLSFNVDTLESEISEKTNLISTLQVEVDSKQQEIQTLTQNNASLNSQITNLNKEIQTKTNEIQNLNTTINTQNTQITNLTNQNTSLNNTITNLNSDIENYQQRISELEEQLANAGGSDETIIYTANYFSGYSTANGEFDNIDKIPTLAGFEVDTDMELRSADGSYIFYGWASSTSSTTILEDFTGVTTIYSVYKNTTKGTLFSYSSASELFNNSYVRDITEKEVKEFSMVHYIKNNEGEQIATATEYTLEDLDIAQKVKIVRYGTTYNLEFIGWTDSALSLEVKEVSELDTEIYAIYKNTSTNSNFTFDEVIVLLMDIESEITYGDSSSGPGNTDPGGWD